MNSNINCICLVFLHCAFPNVYSKSLGQHRQSHTVCTFWCVLSDSPQNAVMWGCEITQGCSTASPSPTRRGQPSPERCAPPSPPTYASSSPCHSSLAMYMGRLCSLWATTKSSKVRAAISRTLCSSISSIFITISPQFRVVHGQVLLYVGHHQILHMNLSCKHFHFHFLFCLFLAFEKISSGGKCVILGGGVVLFRGWRCAFLGGGDVSNLGGGDALG